MACYLASACLSALLFGGCSNSGTAHEAAADRRAPAGHTVARIRSTRVRDAGLVGVLFHPAPGRPSAAALVLGGSEGGIPRGLARSLVAAGHPALALGYFGAPGLPRRFCRIPIEYFGRALVWLHRRDPGQPVALVGGSRGSEAVLLTAVYYPREAEGVVAVAPSAAVVGGVCRAHRTVPGTLPVGGAAWTFHGHPVTHLPPGDFDPTPPIQRRYLIPVWRLEAPLLAIGAGADQVWRSATYARVLFRGASQSARTPPGGLAVFPAAGHLAGCFAPDCPTKPRLNGEELGGTRAANERAQRRTRGLIVRFLNRLSSS